MKNALLVAALLFLTACSRGQTQTSKPSPAQPVVVESTIAHTHRAALHIGQHVLGTGSTCSGTAIGPHAILTASHCEEATDELYIEFVPRPVQIVERIRDGNDHTIYFVKGVTFPVYLPVRLADPLLQGTDVTMWGNPGNFEYQLRKGYITGYIKDEINPLAALFGAEPDPPKILFSFPVWHGDSGAGICNAAGEVIAVVSEMVDPEPKDEDTHPYLTAAWPLAFTQAQVDSATAFGVDKAGK